MDDHFYALTEPLPTESFYVQVDGFLNSGVYLPLCIDVLVVYWARAKRRNNCKSLYLHIHFRETQIIFSVFLFDHDKIYKSNQANFSLTTGQAFTRIFPTMVMSVMCSVELVVDKSVMSAEAGRSATAYYRVDNYGPEATFDFFATDEKKFISDWSPASYV